MTDETDSRAPRGRAYHGDGVTVFYNVRRCAHFAECVRGLPAVFDVNQRPWIQPVNGRAELVAEVVRRCPTGASLLLGQLDRLLETTDPKRPVRGVWGR
jgi:uncharacterized Fe-S cluster protein YjdI